MPGPSFPARILCVDDIDGDALPALPGAAAPAHGGIDYARLVRAARLAAERAALRQAIASAHRRRARQDGAPGADTLSEPDAGPAQGAADEPLAQATSQDEHAQERRADDWSDGADEDDEGTDEAARAGRAVAEASGGKREARLRARERRIEAWVQPFVAALADQHARIVMLMHFLAHRVADFCSDEAIVENGNWVIRIRLDPALLPECMLSLTLSYFDLALRFETRSEATRQLIFRHQVVLKNQLVALLRHTGTPRDVSIEAS